VREKKHEKQKGEFLVEKENKKFKEKTNQ